MFVSTGTHSQQFGGCRAGVCPSGHSAQRTFEQGPPGPPCAAAAVPTAAVEPDAAVPVSMLVSVAAVPTPEDAPAAVEVSPCPPAHAPRARRVKTIISNNNLFMEILLSGDATPKRRDKQGPRLFYRPVAWRMASWSI
jgi:hypothetical protein